MRKNSYTASAEGMLVQDAEVLFERGNRQSQTTIIIPLYNYAHHIEQALQSAAAQSTDDVMILVVDDCSTDQSVETVLKWMKMQTGRKGLTLLKNSKNSKLSITRNTGINYSRSEYCFMLDADNIVYPRCVEKHVQALEARPEADAAYSLIEVFEGRRDVIGAGVFIKEGLIHGNFIDAMAMFRRSALLAMNGYENLRHGWEDYELWLRMIEQKKIAIHIPEILSRYRQHERSMLRTQTNRGDNNIELRAYMKKRFSWLDLH
ncbi:hypothetical protein NSU_4817 [Novosphingobium pentaromativorans US6-1]|uniref:Glycosyltransferase 2-like domain-containing protein n=1 Tax=Novosphingobium pentaromativorans US6-1 TaxID=1088721 RepID=G6EKE6_9SPHN|nr:hypothetical protein NSU_4817 [Novosphingobium pentaromativorans US6-1]